MYMSLADQWPLQPGRIGPSSGRHLIAETAEAMRILPHEAPDLHHTSNHLRCFAQSSMEIGTEMPGHASASEKELLSVQSLVRLTKLHG